jgi:RNA polymerase sigma-70 factor (ECF subfamily)
MPHANVGTTNLADLRAVIDWQDHPAWIAFQKRYDPLLRDCCARLRLQSAAADEVRQETWIAVANRMQSFAYDPNGTFRGWLWKVCHHKAMDLLERRRNDRTFPLDERDEGIRRDRRWVELGQFAGTGGGGPPPDDDAANTALAGLFREAEEIQAAVKERVEPQTWEAFWLVGVVLWTVDETAQALRMSHAAVYKAKARVTKMLQAEAHRRALAGMDTGSAGRGG